mgnify:CR=1 FL=1
MKEILGIDESPEYYGEEEEYYADEYDVGLEETSNDSVDELEEEGEPMLAPKLEDEEEEPVRPNNVLVVEEDEDDLHTSDSDSSEDSKGDDILTLEEKSKRLSDKIIACLFQEDEVGLYSRNTLFSSMKPEVFRNENFVLYSILYHYRDRIKNVNIDREFIELYLDGNKDLIDKSRSFVDVHAYGEVDGSEIVGYIVGVLKHYNRLKGFETMTKQDFDLVLEKYMVVFKQLEAQKVYVDATIILQDGKKIGRKNYIGFDDSYNYTRRRLAEIEGLIDRNQGSGFTSMRDIILNQKDADVKNDKIADFGKLTKLNEYYGGIYSRTFYEVLAPSKGGKSKFCARVCHTATVVYGNNVSVWAVEGGNEAWTAQMRAIHFDYCYNEGVSYKEKKYGVCQDMILKGTYPDNEIRDLESTSALDLAVNTEYGNIDFIDRPFNVETFLDDIDASVKANNSKLLIVDYLQLMQTSGNKTERERVADAYKMLLGYCRKSNIAILTPAQYKQVSIDSFSNSKATDDLEVRTAGGVSAEVFRTPDIIISLWASTADLRNKRMKILSVPSRLAIPFPPIDCYADLGPCQFISIGE